MSKLAVEAEVIPYFSGWVAGEVENVAISTQVEVVVELKLELSLAKQQIAKYNKLSKGTTTTSTNTATKEQQVQ